MIVIDRINEFWGTYGAYIGAALIPTIITGLTISGKTKDIGPWVEKTWNVVKQLMDFLSVVTHKDKLGTFKLPLTTSVAKEEKMKDELNVEVVKTTPTEETKETL